MKVIKHIGRLVLLTFALAPWLGGCTKEYRNTGIGSPEPVFFVYATLPSGVFYEAAGDDSYYMSSTYRFDTNNVPEMIGTLGDPNSTTGKPSFEFIFRGDNTFQAGQPLHPDSIFTPGNQRINELNIQAVDPNSVRLKFSPKSGGLISNIEWAVNLSSWYQNYSTEVIIDTTVIKYMTMGIRGEVDNDCISFASRCIYFRHLNCQSDIEMFYDNNNLYRLQIPAAIEAAVDSVGWTVDGQPQYSAGDLFTNVILSDGMHNISAEVFMKDGCTNCISRNFSVSALNAPHVKCSMDFTYTVNKSYVPDATKYRTWEIIYRDGNGGVYSTRNSATNSDIRLLEYEEYDENELGQRTAKIHLNGVLRLANASGSNITINDFDATIAVGLPE